jgi:very-short-patch-repair endonuclease
LWEELRSSKLGVRFRRQVVVAGCIVDFFAPAARLVVEVAGVQHRLTRSGDARRDERLVVAGLRVLRVPAQLVLRQLDAALNLVVCALSAPR